MNHHAVLGRDIFTINKYFKIYFKNALKEYDLNSAEGMVLLALFGNDGQVSEDYFDEIHARVLKTQDEIISEIQYDKAMMTRIMQSLEKKGYIIRQSNPADNRSFLFSVTASANDFKPKLLAILRGWNDNLLKNVASLDIVKAAINTMAQNAKKIVIGD